MNEKNLIPIGERTSRELREMTRKGGIASGEARRRKKSLKQQALEIGKMLAPKDNEALADSLRDLGVDPDESTLETAMITALIKRAIYGDVKAFQTYVDLVEGKGNEKLEAKLRKEELLLKKQELELKRKELEKGNSNDKVVIINDLGEYDGEDNQIE